MRTFSSRGPCSQIVTPRNVPALKSTQRRSPKQRPHRIAAQAAEHLWHVMWRRGTDRQRRCALCCRIWLYSVPARDCIWLYFVHDCIWLYMTASDCTWPRLTVRRYVPVRDWICLHAPACLPVCLSACACLRLPALIPICTHGWTDGWLNGVLVFFHMPYICVGVYLTF